MLGKETLTLEMAAGASTLQDKIRFLNASQNGEYKGKAERL